MGTLMFHRRQSSGPSEPGKYICGIYGGSFHFSNLPSSSFQASVTLMGAGCTFLCIAAFLAIIALCIPRISDKRLTLFTGYVQILAGEYTMFCFADPY